MQRQALIGQHLLQRKEGQCACGGGCPRCSENKKLQTKLKINEPGDIYEQEADRVADEVLATSSNPTVGGVPPRIQRVSGQSTGQTDTASPSVDRVLASAGSPLEPALQHDMSQRFGHDFSNVRVHSGAAAEQSARDVSAHAYTAGHNIVFGAGQYAPETHAGRRLLAHELTHVVQQSRITDKATQRKLIQRTTVGSVLNEFFSVFSSERLWVMPASDNYTGIVRTWPPVISAVSQAKADLKANCANWSANHMTDPSWTPGMTSPPVADPNAHNIDVAHPPGTDPDTCRNAFIIYAATSGSLFPAVQTFELYTCSVGSFDIYATVDSIDCAAKTAQMNIWMYNRMSRTSFGQFASNRLFALSGMESQYMWWNWTESVSWGPSPATPSGGSGVSDGWNP